MAEIENLKIRVSAIDEATPILQGIRDEIDLTTDSFVTLDATEPSLLDAVTLFAGLVNTALLIVLILTR